MPLIQEHSIKIKADMPKVVTEKMEVFYNPIMASNRNISILLLNSIENKEMNLTDPLAGSGIRSLRFLKELKRNKIKHLYVNDMKEGFEEVFEENLRLNKIKFQKDQLTISNQEANLF